MTSTPLTDGLLRQRLRPILDRYPAASVIGIQSENAWQGAVRLEANGRDFQVAWCPSVLAVREQLVAHNNGGPGLVVLTDQRERDLGDDALARLAGSKLFAIDRWRLLAELFEADRIDPRLTTKDWLAEDLIAVAPIDGFRPVPAGFLDQETAWANYLELRFGFPDGRTDLVAFLEWSMRAENVSELASAAEEVRTGVLRRIAVTAGAPGEALSGLFRSRRGSDAVPLGLALEVVFSEEPNGKADRQKASIRLESLLDGVSMDPEVGRQWAATAAELADRLGAERPATYKKTAKRGDELLEELKIGELGYLSDRLPSGGKLRSEQYAQVIRDTLKSGTDGKRKTLAEEAWARLRRHRGLDESSRRAADSAIRLLRGLVETEQPNARSFPEAARGYAEQGAFLDWARDEIHGSESDPTLGVAYSKLLQRAEERRHALNEVFGKYLADWFSTEASSPELIPLESVLDEVVVPVARKSQVLLLVIDGLSLPIYQRLLEEIVARNWSEIGPETEPGHRWGIGLLPSLTQVCRSSLLSGERRSGDQAKEKRRFENHAALRQVSKGGSPPVLFHKAEIRSDRAEVLAPDLQEEIENSQRRIVGVVVNAVDDYLDKGEQLRTNWGLHAIKPLAALLEAAATNERVVVLTADHGHLPERGLERVREPDHGDRYREASDAAKDGEVLVEGPRVLTQDQRIIVPWTERIRYGRRKTGYHGGASPQELLVPVTVLSSGTPPEGWLELPIFRPSWWAESPTGPEQPEPTGRRARRKKTTPSRKEPDEDQKTLFPSPDTQEEPAGPAWIGELFESEVYREQRALSGRTAPADDKVQALLAALDERGGLATRAALGQILELPRQRLDGLVAATERLLNVEGYAALRFNREAGEVRLDRNLLKQQFQLP